MLIFHAVIQNLKNSLFPKLVYAENENKFKSSYNNLQVKIMDLYTENGIYFTISNNCHDFLLHILSVSIDIVVLG